MCCKCFGSKQTIFCKPELVLRSHQRSADTRNIRGSQFWHPAGFWSFSGFRDFDILRVFRGYQDCFAFICMCKTCFKSKLMCYKITLKTFKPCLAYPKHYFGVSKDGRIFDRPYPTRKPDSPCWLFDFK